MQKDKSRGLALLLTVVLVPGMILSSCAPVGPDFVKPEAEAPADAEAEARAEA